MSQLHCRLAHCNGPLLGVLFHSKSLMSIICPPATLGPENGCPNVLVAWTQVVATAPSHTIFFSTRTPQAIIFVILGGFCPPKSPGKNKTRGITCEICKCRQDNCFRKSSREQLCVRGYLLTVMGGVRGHLVCFLSKRLPAVVETGGSYRP